MELPMSEESEVAKYYNWFLELAKPLFNLHVLEDKECNTLFWCGFHPDNHAMLLYHVSEYPCLQPRVYYYLQEVYNATCNIFSPRD
jgi:hypothetical protein